MVRVLRVALAALFASLPHCAWAVRKKRASDAASAHAAAREEKAGAAWAGPSMNGWAVEKLETLMDRFNGDIAVMNEVRTTFHATSSMTDVPEDIKPKVAFMFLVKDGLDQHELWQTFFRGAHEMTSPFSIYFHQYAPKSGSSIAAREAWKTFGATFIPTVKTGWGQLAGVEYAMLWEALRDPGNAQFVFSSEGTVPFKSAPYVYKYLIDQGSAKRSKVCFRKAEDAFNPVRLELQGDCIYRDPLQAVTLPVNRASTAAEGKPEADPPLPGWKGRVRKHDQWVVLARRHAVDVVKHGERAMKKYLAAVLRSPQPDSADPCATGASDESFVATALLAASELEVKDAPFNDTLLELEKYGVGSECTTFTYWRHCWKDTVLGASAGWNHSRLRDMSTIFHAAKSTAKSMWLDARVGLAKTLNDSPRDFGLAAAAPTKEYMQALVTSGMLFGRKFGKDETGKVPDDLNAMLPQMWAKWDNDFNGNFAAEHLAWPTTDVDDPRVANTVKERISLAKSTLEGFSPGWN